MALRFDFSFYSVMFEDKKNTMFDSSISLIHIKISPVRFALKKTPFFMGGDHRTHTNNLCGDLCILLTYIH